MWLRGSIRPRDHPLVRDDQPANETEIATSCSLAWTGRQGSGATTLAPGSGASANNVARAPGPPRTALMFGGAMIEHRNLVKVLAEFARTLTGGYEITDVLYRLADSVVDVLGAAGAGVSLSDDAG